MLPLTERERRQRWLAYHTGLRIKRVGGHTVYRVLGRATVQKAWGKMEVVNLRREDGSTLTIGYPEAMSMEIVR